MPLEKLKTRYGSGAAQDWRSVLNRALNFAPLQAGFARVVLVSAVNNLTQPSRTSIARKLLVSTTEISLGDTITDWKIIFLGNTTLL